jgi:hypothetical protein
MSTKRALHYILDENHNPVPEPDVIKWAAWWAENRFMAEEEVARDTRVATIFLGLNQHLSFIDEPSFFETTVFRGAFAEEVRDYPTYEAAMEGHRQLVDKFRQQKR